MDKKGDFSKDNRHRFKLSRVWNTDKPIFTYVGLNPSTADAQKDDTTIKKLIGITKYNGGGGFIICNLFSLISPNPYILTITDIEITSPPINDKKIKSCIKRSDKVILMWGVNGKTGRRCDSFLYYFINQNFYCLGINNDGSPKHPLYIRTNTKFKRYDFTGTNN